jgi:hypothetical protein
VDGWGPEGFEEVKLEAGAGAEQLGLTREFRGVVNAWVATSGDVYNGLEEEGEL